MKRLIIIALILIASTAWGEDTIFYGTTSGGGGIQTASNCNQAQYFPIGVLCQDTDDGKLYKGTGEAVVEIAAGSSGDVTAAATSQNWGDGTGPVVWTYLVTGTDPTITVTAGAFTLNTTLALGANNITTTGSLGATGAGKLTKGWFTDVESTNYPTVNGNVVFNQAVTSTSNPAFSTINIVGDNALSLGTSRTYNGKATFKSGTALNDYYFLIQGGNFGANLGWTLPVAAPAGENYLLRSSTTGVLSYVDPATVGGGGGTPALDDVTNPDAAKTFTLLDNNASALSLGSTGKADIIKVITTDAGEGVTMSGTLGVTGVITATGGVSGNASTATALAADPANCAAGQIALGVTAAGVAECTATPSGLTSVGATTFTGALTGTASGNQASSATLTSLAGLTETNGGFAYGTADNAYAWLAAGATGKVLIGKGAAAPEWTPYTFPATVPTVGKTLISDGTNLIGSTALGTGAYATIANYATLASPTFTGSIILPSANADPAATAGSLVHDSTVTNHLRGALRWYDGTGIRQVVDLTAAIAEGCTDDYVVAYDSTADAFYCKADATGVATTIVNDTVWDAAGDMVQGTGADTAAKLTKGAEGTILRAGATSNAYTTATYPATTTTQRLLYSTAANTIGELSAVNNGIVAFNSSGTLGAYTNMSSDDSAFQFYSATASKGTLKNLLTGSTSGKLLTVAWNHTDDKTLNFPDPTTNDSVAYGSAPIRLNTGGTTARVWTIPDAPVTIPAGTLQVVNNEKLASFAWDGGASAVATASSKRCTLFPAGATIVGVYAMADASTTSHFHVYQDAFAAGARSTTVTGAVDIGATLGSLDTTLTGWDKSITAADEICISVEANDNAKWLNVIIYGTR